jgi:glycosyltransferase involved in cell wall biosynthesis
VEKITFCIPSKNNCRYLKACIPSIRKNSYRKDHDIIVFVDEDTDGTTAWLESVKDEYNIRYIVNDTDGLYGIGRAYDKCIEESETDIFMIFHADMMLGKDADREAFKYLDRNKVVCSTRIEPPLHPEGPEKIVIDFGMWPEPDVEEGWREKEFDEFVEKSKVEYKDKVTHGCFAPWMMYKDEFLNIGGHDERFRSAREDSDVFNRLVLGGFELIQSWQSFVYHLTARGGQFQHGKLTKDHSQKSERWQKLMAASTREFIRKWGGFVNHDPLMMPIIAPKYNIGFIIKNCTINHIRSLEPWCSVLYADLPQEHINEYIRENQPDTLYDLSNRVALLLDFDFIEMDEAENTEQSSVTDLSGKAVEESSGYWLSTETHNILIEVDGSKMENKHLEFMQQLPYIIRDTNEVGKFSFDIFDITINSLNSHEKELINVI